MAFLLGTPILGLQLIVRGDFILDFDLAVEINPVLDLLQKYRDRQMDLADACIVRMTELMTDVRVLTLDRTDFAVYRRNGRDLIPILTPPT